MIVVWRIIEHCNLACDFCAYDRRLPFERHEVEAELVENFSGILGDYQKASGDKVLLSWIGGEPMLWEPLFRVSQFLRETYGIACSTTTNGSTLHLARVRSEVLANLTELTVSVDGLAEFHNSVRNWPNGWGRLETAIKALSKERDDVRSPLLLRANVVLMHDNLSQFEALCDALADWGFDEITFNQLGGRDRPEFFPMHRLSESDALSLISMIPSLQKRMALRGVRLCGSTPYLERIEASSRNQKLAITNCDPGKKFLFIDERGRVSPCNFTSSEFGIPISDITNVDDLESLPRVFSKAQIIRNHTACQDCPSTQVSAKFAS